MFNRVGAVFLYIYVYYSCEIMYVYNNIMYTIIYVYRINCIVLYHAYLILFSIGTNMFLRNLKVIDEF